MRTRGNLEAVELIKDKVECPLCSKKRMFFCYDCLLNMPTVDAIAPRLDLPANVHIIKHPSEHNSKSTALHCALIAPDHTKVYSSKDEELPHFSKDFPNCVLVYPGKDAMSVADHVEKHGKIKNFVVLDATWLTVKGIRRRPELEDIPTVSLKTYKTEYWRPQKGFSDEYLATIEAIRFAIKENEEASGGEVDEDYLKELLFWFYFFKSKVNTGSLIKNPEVVVE